jgi:hypothetical protein
MTDEPTMKDILDAAKIGQPRCQVCGEPMPEGETMFKFHGYSGPCPKPPLEKQRAGNLKAQHWPFVESPGDFAARLAEVSDGPGGLLAGIRTVLIENPPTLADEYLRCCGVKFLS